MNTADPRGETTALDGEADAGSPHDLRIALTSRIRARSAEIEEAVVAKLEELEPEVSRDLEGATVLRAAVGGLVEAITAIVEQGEDWKLSLPAGLVAQVRYSARRGVSLETVMRGYFAVGTVLMGLLTEEMPNLPPESLSYLIGVQSRHGDRVASAIAAEYEDEVASLDVSPDKGAIECVDRLLAGEPADLAALDYDLDAWHVGAVVTGPEREGAVRDVAGRLGVELLMIPRSADVAWAWIGADRADRLGDLERVARPLLGDRAAMAVGVPREGLEGWRRSHREARLGHAVMLRRPSSFVRASDVAVVTAVIDNDVARRSLVDAYLGPLDRDRAARHLRETLRAYFASDCNAVSTAEALGVDRHTVQRRLRRVEQAVGRSVDECRVEMDVALRVELLDPRAG